MPSPVAVTATYCPWASWTAFEVTFAVFTSSCPISASSASLVAWVVDLPRMAPRAFVLPFGLGEVPAI